MAATQAGVVLRHLRELVSADGTGNLSDPELLERFTRTRDEGAFAALVRRHGPLVLGVCRRVLGNHADAEDAFQAAFLVLAQKAAAIARHTSLPCWLYQVAYRVALKAKARAATRYRHEQRTAGREATDPLAEITGRELLAVLDEELQTLSERHRAPLVLCYLEGHTCDEAARRLGCSPRTLKRWLDQARHCLGRRLARRGLSLPAALLAGGLATGPTRAAVSTRLAAETAAAAARSSASTAAVAALAEGVLREAPASRLRVVTLVCALAGIVAVAASGLAGAIPIPSPEAPAARPNNDKPAPLPQKEVRKEQGVLTVSGRVLDASGKPLAGAAVAVVGDPKVTGRGGDLLSEGTHVLATGTTDAEGHFRLAARGVTSGSYRSVHLLARAPGLGVELYSLNPAEPPAQVTLRLAPERIARGRLVDLQGQPAAGVSVQLRWLGKARNGNSEGVNFNRPPRGLKAWPEPVRTDALGKFTLPGLSASQNASLFVEGEHFAPQALYLDAPAFLVPEGLNRALAPAQVIEGRVLAADTGKPVPLALLTVYSSDREVGSYVGLGGKADADGRFRLNPHAGKWFTVSAHAPTGEPYLAIEQRLQWEAGKVKRTLDLKLPRGVVIRGKVVETGSGKPVARAAVDYHPQVEGNPNFRRDIVSGWQAYEVSEADGSFRITVLPGAGHLLILGPGGDYIHEEIGNNVLHSGRPGGLRHRPDAIVKLPLHEKTRGEVITVNLKRGVTVKGRLVGPDGQPVDKALMICRLHVTALSLFWRFPIEVRDGQFELHGLDPEISCPVSFLEPGQQWGATVQLSGKQAGKLLTVKLQPCGRAVARFVDAKGKPVAGHRPMLNIVVTPGATRYDFKATEKGQLNADEEYLANVDRHNYWKGPVTDAEGRCAFPALIPGMTYRLTTFVKGAYVVARDFTAEAGKTFDAGDITTARPE